jgi:hypothetical protein
MGRGESHRRADGAKQPTLLSRRRHMPVSGPIASPHKTPELKSQTFGLPLGVIAAYHSG